MKKIVFLPVETEVREIDAKLVMASKIADENTTCFLGQHNVLNQIAPLFKGGVYMGKNIFLENMNSTNEIYELYKKNNFSILWNHEEGAIYGGSKEKWNNELKELLDPNRLKEDDMILCWGSYQKEYYESFKADTPIRIVGGYRLDLGHNSDLRALLKSTNRVKQKDYILIDTNCAWGNHFMPHQQEYKVFQEKAEKNNSDHLTKHNLLGLLSEDLIKIGFFCNLISYLMENNPNKHFVLRPHPTESLSFYENVFHGFPNIKITKDYSAIEWIENSSVLIQSGCTTALEAYFLEKPIVSFHPFDSKYSVDVTKGIGQTCTSFAEVNNFINNPTFKSEILDNDLGIKSLIDNFNTKSSSIDIIVDEIKKANTSKPESKIDFRKIKGIENKNSIKNFLKYYPRKFFFEEKQESFEMATDHFPGFKEEEIIKKINYLKEQSGKKINLNYLSDNLIVMSS
tara:strand:+ start:5352 stop:6719 length:1368 start_codon:yes stop_codon:yes gene_type:complete